jgi:hypothetical protein
MINSGGLLPVGLQKPFEAGGIIAATNQVRNADAAHDLRRQ